jgi:hypothetical protein
MGSGGNRTRELRRRVGEMREKEGDENLQRTGAAQLLLSEKGLNEGEWGLGRKKGGWGSAGLISDK